MTNPGLDSPPEELVYATAIIILSNELYPRKLEIVREYIQNASDALDSFMAVAPNIGDSAALQIKISIQGKSLLIWDNGIGMDATEIQKLKRIAYSEKKVGEGAGYKGIGRLAGIAVAKKLVISSTSYGDPKLHQFEFRARDFQDDIAEKKKEGWQEPATTVINRHTTISELDVDPYEHYTMVELREIDDAYPELLTPTELIEYIGDIGPVEFAPDFAHGPFISSKIRNHIPNYSPKTIWLSTTIGDRQQIYKPYTDKMVLAEPEFIEVINDKHELIAYCWYATKGKEMLGKIRPAGRKFVVDGSTPTERKRLAGLVYKLFGFSIGDRSLPMRTLWKKDYTRPLWFTGEIHIADGNIKPTTDRSDFVDNAARNLLYQKAQRVTVTLNAKAQAISNTRNAYDSADKYQAKFSMLESQLNNGGLDRAVLRLRKEELREALDELKVGKLSDPAVYDFVQTVSNRGRILEERLEEVKKKSARSEINDVAVELKLTSQARKVYMIAMETLEHFLREDKDTFYQISELIQNALRRKY